MFRSMLKSVLFFAVLAIAFGQCAEARGGSSKYLAQPLVSTHPVHTTGVHYTEKPGQLTLTTNKPGPMPAPAPPKQPTKFLRSPVKYTGEKVAAGGSRFPRTFIIILTVAVLAAIAFAVMAGMGRVAGVGEGVIEKDGFVGAVYECDEPGYCYEWVGENGNGEEIRF